MSDSHKGETGPAVEHARTDSGEASIGRLGEWRRSIRQRPHAYRLYRIVIGLIGLGIVVSGLVLVPLPGPGWVIVFVGLAILATEFESAAKVERFARARVKAWSNWVVQQSLPIRTLLGLVAGLAVVSVMYVVLLIGGVPGWVPDSWAALVPGLPA